MKRFLIKLIPFLAVPIILISINYYVDPANLYNESYEIGISDYLTKGYNVTNVVNYNERLLQKDFIEKMKVAPTKIVLGSSRIMEIHKTYFNESNFINNGMSGATLEDELAIYDLYEKKGYQIKKVILDLDPWMLNDNHQQVRWKALEKEYKEFAAKLNRRPSENLNSSLLDQYGKYSELTSFSYFKTSIQYLIKGVSNNYKPTKLMENNGFTRLTDGSIIYDAPYRLASQTEVDLKAKECIAENPVYSLGEFDKLSPQYQKLLVSFVSYLQDKGVEVEFYLSPFHPVVYNFFEKNVRYQNVFSAETYFKTLAGKLGIKVYGSYNPKVYNLNNTYFHDGLHCNGKAIVEIMKSVSPMK